MRTGFMAITTALGFAGLVLSGPSRVHAACETCNGAASGNYPGAVASHPFHRSYRAKVHVMLPLYGADLPACFWRKMRLWDPDGQYWLVSRVQFCR